MSEIENRIPPEADDTGVPAPPKWLLWGVVGIFVLAIIGGVAGIYVFRDVLRPGQQQRIIDALPFMRSFMRPTPVGGTIPTPSGGSAEGRSPLDLLNATIAVNTPTGVPTATIAANVPATATSAPTSTSEPATSTIEATPEPPPTNTAPTQPTLTPASGAQNSAGQQSVSTSSRPRAWNNTGFVWERQTWNNCGPTNVTMALSYYGWREDQTYAAERLKPEREDKNVTPQELVAFVNEQSQVNALSRIGGDTELLRRLIAAEFPVIVESGAMFEGYDWVGHYETLVGYDDTQGVFYVYDSFRGSGVGGQGITVPYDEFDQNWRAFNRVFIVVYLPGREAELSAILGDLADPALAAENAFAVAQEEARANPRDPFAWFNMGTALTRLERYDEAANAFDGALRAGGLPWRMFWYQFGIYEAYLEMERYDDVLALVQSNLNNGGQWVEETHYWQGRVLEAQGDTAGARAAYQRALNINPGYAQATTALEGLGS